MNALDEPIVHDLLPPRRLGDVFHLSLGKAFLTALDELLALRDLDVDWQLLDQFPGLLQSLLQPCPGPSWSPEISTAFSSRSTLSLAAVLTASEDNRTL